MIGEMGIAKCHRAKLSCAMLVGFHLLLRLLCKLNVF